MEINKSDIVLSLNGRDTGHLFYVLEIDDGYAQLADGRSRRLEKPKRKKLKHLQLAAKDKGQIAEKIRAGTKISNSDLRKALAEFMAEAGEKGGM